MNGALKGIRVIDYTQIVAGPFAGSLLSDMGADVIKVEPTWGEPQRESAPFIPNETRNYFGNFRNNYIFGPQQKTEIFAIFPS